MAYRCLFFIFWGRKLLNSKFICSPRLRVTREIVFTSYHAPDFPVRSSTGWWRQKRFLQLPSPWREAHRTQGDGQNSYPDASCSPKNIPGQFHSIVWAFEVSQLSLLITTRKFKLQVKGLASYLAK